MVYEFELEICDTFRIQGEKRFTCAEQISVSLNTLMLQQHTEIYFAILRRPTITDIDLMSSLHVVCLVCVVIEDEGEWLCFQQRLLRAVQECETISLF